MSDDVHSVLVPPTDGSDAAASAPASPVDKVGPGRPPKESRWRKGQPSPNPTGRPRKPSVWAELERLVEAVLAEKVTLKQGETLTILQTGLKQWGIQFAKGDRHARDFLFFVTERLGVDLRAGRRKEIEEALTADRQAILDAYVVRRTRATVPSKLPRVLAPPELLDDDIDGPEKVDDHLTEPAGTGAAQLPPGVLTIVGRR